MGLCWIWLRLQRLKQWLEFSFFLLPSICRSSFFFFFFFGWVFIFKCKNLKLDSNAEKVALWYNLMHESDSRFIGRGARKEKSDPKIAGIKEGSVRGHEPLPLWEQIQDTAFWEKKDNCLSDDYWNVNTAACFTAEWDLHLNLYMCFLLLNPQCQYYQDTYEPVSSIMKYSPVLYPA